MLGGEEVALEVALAVSYSLAREVVTEGSEFRCCRGESLIIRPNYGLRRDVLFDDFPLERETASFGQPGEFGHDETVVTIGLYDARLTHQFVRLLHEIEARQARRNAECGVRNADSGLQIAENETEMKNEPNSAAAAPAAGEEAREEKMKNEPNSAVSVAQPSTAAQSPQAGPAPGVGDRGAPVPQTEEAPEKAPVPHVKNEPNPAGLAQPGSDSIQGIEHSSCKIPHEPLNSCVRSS